MAPDYTIQKNLSTALGDTSISNLSLAIRKYPKVFTREGDDIKLEQENVGEFLGQVVQRYNDNNENNEIRSAYANFFGRWKEMLTQNGSWCSAFSAALSSRMVIGLGGGGVLETAMTVHHVYGVPYIPGTAVKGILRAYCRQENKPKDWLLKVFGNDPGESDTKPQKGHVRFLDAYPEKFPKLEIDIMNPHYPEYYQGECPPADCLNPKIIKFLTVAKAEKFVFAVMANNQELRSEVVKMLKKAVEEHGLGAKTAVGYGYFISPSDITLQGAQDAPQQVVQQHQQRSAAVASYQNTDGSLKDKYLVRQQDGTVKFNDAIGNNPNPSKKQKQEFEKAKKYFEKHYKTGKFTP